jgi:serine kinase of HPr protein (carbohydrate metabolism regulator)
VIVHAGLIARRIGGAWRGALIQGASGAGKSDLALRALEHGFSLVADDRVLLFVSGGQLFGRAPTPLHGMLEARGVGIIQVSALRFAPVTLNVRCQGDPLGVERFPDWSTQPILGVKTPEIDLWPLADSAPAKIGRALERLGARD